MRRMIQFYGNGNMLSLISGIRNGRFTVMPITPRWLPSFSVEPEDADAVLRFSWFNGATIIDILLSLAREEFESRMGYHASERARELVSL